MSVEKAVQQLKTLIEHFENGGVDCNTTDIEALKVLINGYIEKKNHIAKECITMIVNQETNAIDLYNFIQKYLPFDTVIELYKLIQYKLINLDDEPYNYCNLVKKEESDE